MNTNAPQRSTIGATVAALVLLLAVLLIATAYPARAANGAVATANGLIQ